MYFEYEIPFETCINLQKREVGQLSLENKEDGKIKIRFYLHCKQTCLLLQLKIIVQQFIQQSEHQKTCLNNCFIAKHLLGRHLKSHSDSSCLIN